MPANKNPIAQGRLELQVKDFGPIVEARLDLRPLTVLVGPSNTGKSYLAILIYALHRHWSAEIFGPRSLGRRATLVRFGEFADASDQAIDEAVEFVQRINDHTGKPSSEETPILPASVAKLLSNSYDLRGGYLDGEIRRCFGLEGSAALIRKGARGSADIAVRIHHRDNSDAGGQNFRVGARNAEFRIALPGDAKLPVGIRLDNLPPPLFEALIESRSTHGGRWREGLLGAFTSELLDGLVTAIHPLVVGSLVGDAFYLPADRTGVMHAHNVVVSALIGSAAMTGVRPAARTPVLSGVLADFLEELIELGQRPGIRRSLPHDFGVGIEKTVLRGLVGVEQSEAVGYPRFTYKPEGWKESLSLANASSMVSELAPVVLYLRHRVQPGNVLIIEEPEAHLHPAMQVQFTREITALVQAGIQVVVTTHSEWVLEELANIVGRSRLSESAGPALPASDVGVWLFEPKERPRGSVVREVPLDESGLYPTGFGEVAAALHNDWADISSRSQETG